MKKLLFFIISLTLFINAEEKPFVVLRCRDAGMFSIFNDVLAMLKHYDQGAYRGIQVNFSKMGAYYDPEMGKNWWNYYCEPISFGLKRDVSIVKGRGGLIPDYPNGNPDFTDREEAHRLINKYIRFRPHIQKKITLFMQDHFHGNYIIGIHYRGTDNKESEFVPFEQVAYRVKKKIQTLRLRNYKIFLATDEQRFLEYMIDEFGDHLCYLKDAFRGVTDVGIHQDPNLNKYKAGEDAVLDCILLSRCDLLFRTASNLSLWSTFFNPDLPVIELSKKFRSIKS